MSERWRHRRRAVDILLRIARGSHAAADLAHAIIQGTSDALMLGLLRDDTLDELTAHYYETAAPTFVSATHNASGLYRWEEAAIARDFPTAGHVLITSAGGGREAVAFARAGWRVTATECVPALAEELQKRLQAFPLARAACVPGDEVIRAAELYDAAIVGWGAYSHLTGRRRRIALLDAVRRNVEPGAPVLVSFLAKMTSTRREKIIAHAATLIRSARRDRTIEPGETVFRGCYRRVFTLEEVATELSTAHFERVRTDAEGYGHAVAFAPAPQATPLRA